MKKKDIFFTGLMLFALFFGAGNLIFPPYLGMEAGKAVWPAIFGFVVTGVSLPVLAVAAVALAKDGIQSIGNYVHPLFSLCFSIAVYLAIGPFFGIPRGASVTYEMGIKPFFNGGGGALSLLLFTIIFFALVYWLSLNPSKLVDRIGEILTPILLLSIAVLCITGIIQLRNPLQAPAEKYASAPFFKGFMEGYLTMDTIAALAFGIVVVNALKDRGVQQRTAMVKATIQAGFIAGTGLALVYIATALLGARMAVNGPFANGGDLLSSAAALLFGSGGKLLLGVIVALACLTTCIGLTAACAQYFHEITPSISYKTYVMIITIFSLVVSNLGLNQLISLSVPVLTMIYPLAIVLVVMSFFHRFYKGSAKTYGMALLFTAVFSVYDSLNAFGVEAKWLEPLLSWVPFFSVGLGWVVPAIIGAILGFMLDNIALKQHETA
ncbi:branched-chain amino acid transport system II carrier protein [Parageobacillus thermoglucosidasius]|uniref:branched-chain amino acid transport system II carrier protein n=1 Tax=Parageobacillus thermoglucosidasius TaxID=1426 RepID=UPI0001D18983|nr:branched-chain amino acid transport system II carrier protein [Parageobacillus thermoglucosidasius]AEH49563.1 branched-chain amino acid transport system II carrier protein [Parageobacillus thermoglucosidasius C56-YS93]